MINYRDYMINSEDAEELGANAYVVEVMDEVDYDACLGIFNNREAAIEFTREEVEHYGREERIAVIRYSEWINGIFNPIAEFNS